jgi:hypothetical protein
MSLESIIWLIPEYRSLYLGPSSLLIMDCQLTDSHLVS